ncbi:MAG: DUF4870 domain-containing protein [Verrucomicrobia bacterium]|nr:DUF4870 domain-containing protein [Verrucomicrobiota bacterium]
MNETNPPPVPQPSPPPVPQNIPCNPYAVVPPPQPLTGPSSEDRTLAMLCHLLGLLTGFLGPLVLWLVKKDSSPFVDHHGREALNFQITLMVVMFALGIATFVLMFVFIGFLLIPVIAVVGILALIAEIMAAVAGQNGEWYRYPCCIRFV